MQELFLPANLVLLRLKVPLQSSKVTNRKVLIQIPAELFQACDEILHFEVHRLNCSVWKKEELLQQWNYSLYQFKKTSDEAYWSNCLAYDNYQFHTKMYPISFPRC
jgi:hypothetical protein